MRSELYVYIIELDRENLDSLPYLISHGQKIGSIHVLLAMRLEVAHCVKPGSLKRAMRMQYKLKLCRATRLVYLYCSATRTRIDPLFAP